jgi:hypothetical protein
MTVLWFGKEANRRNAKREQQQIPCGDDKQEERQQRQKQLQLQRQERIYAMTNKRTSNSNGKYRDSSLRSE